VTAVIRPEGCEMELLIVGSILLCVVVGTLVGLKLLRIAAHSRKLPEFAVGVALLAHAAVSQPTLLVEQALGDEASLGLLMGIITLRLLAFFVTLVGLSLFTWQVFGAESRWRQALAGTIAVTALIASGVSLWTIWLQLSADLPLSLYRQVSVTPHYVLVFGWVSLESLYYYAQMRKRRALGLADPVVTNRFFVWGAGEGVASLVVLALFVATMTQPGISTSDPLLSWCVTLAGLVNALVWWLTFAPPTAYLRWIRGPAAQIR
jgi:hypothetical protein